MGNCACIQSGDLRRKDYQINLKSIRNDSSKNIYDIKGLGLKESLSIEGTTVVSNHKHLNYLSNISNELSNSLINNNLGIITHESSKKSLVHNSHFTVPEIKNSCFHNNSKNYDCIKVTNTQKYKSNLNNDQYKTSFYCKKKEQYNNGKIQVLKNAETTPKACIRNVPEITLNYKEEPTLTKSFSNTDVRKPILSKLYKHNKRNKITNLD